MLNNHLKELRMEYDISPARLAKFMKVNEQEILDWERGVKEPSLAQIHQLAELFDISYNDLRSTKDKKTKEESTAKNNNKAKKKTKKKTKSKTKNKTKNVKNKTVEKKRNWPLIVILVILLVGGAVCGYLYWKYGDEYSLIQKDTFTKDEVVGTFHDEADYEGMTPVLNLQSDGSYTLSYSDCSLENSGQGTWKLEKAKITLTDTAGKTYSIHVQSANKLKFQSSDLGCAPQKNDIFIRGGSENTNTDETNKDEEATNDSISYIEVGQWSGNHTTLHITSVQDTNAIFTLTCYDPNDANNIATLENITGSIQANTLTFQFYDDGYGNSGNGTIVFDSNKAVFHINITNANDEAQWSIAEGGTLYQ